MGWFLWEPFSCLGWVGVRAGCRESTGREELLGCLKEKWIYERLIPGTDVKPNTSQPIPALLFRAEK